MIRIFYVYCKENISIAKSLDDSPSPLNVSPYLSNLNLRQTVRVEEAPNKSRRSALLVESDAHKACRVQGMPHCIHDGLLPEARRNALRVPVRSSPSPLSPLP